MSVSTASGLWSDGLEQGRRVLDDLDQLDLVDLAEKG
jgi:hypothetical protein